MIDWIFSGTGIENVWMFLLLGSVSAMLVSMAKAGFGGSIGILSMPLMVYACQGQALTAAAVMLPLLIVCDYLSVGHWRGKWNLRVVGNLLPGAVLGVALGWVALYAIRQTGADTQSQTGNAILAMLIGIIALGFVVLQAIKSLRSKPLAFRPVFWQATSVGAVAGLTSTLAHAAGPIVTMYLLPQKMPKERFVATTVLYYWLGNQIKLVPYFALGMISARTFSASALLVPAVAIGVVLGIFLHRKVGQRQFTGIIYTLLALAGLHLIIKSTAALW